MQTNEFQGVTTGGATAAAKCPLCGNSVTPDALGLVECRCAWGGPDDPIEARRGLPRILALLDRRLASRMALADLARLRASHGTLRRLGIGYMVVLALASTVVYLVLLALLAGALALTVFMALNRAWPGAVVGGMLSAFLIYALYPRHPRPKGVVATRQQFPRLAAALDEVSKRIKAPAPQRVVLLPGTQIYVYQHRPWRRFFRRELVLGLGVGALPLLSEQDLKAVLAHELAHYRHGDIALHTYFAVADTALYNIIHVVQGTDRSQLYAISGQRRGAPIAYRPTPAGSPTMFILIAAFVVWLITLPIRVLWWAFHVLRLAESRHAEFAADQVAASAYGPQALMRGLTGIAAAANTLRGLRAEIRDQGSENLYAVMRDHYAGLPPYVLADLRARAIRGFRSLEQTHPIMPDRLRALTFLTAAPAAPAPEDARPAVDLIVPAGAQDADEVERKLTALLLEQ